MVTAYLVPALGLLNRGLRERVKDDSEAHESGDSPHAGGDASNNGMKQGATGRRGWISRW